MVEYNKKTVSDEELLEAANAIFTSQEEDFEKIKTEKWYQTLFHAITFNQDGKKYALRGVSSLAKLQKLFMNIYIENYRKSHEQLDSVIDAVVKQNDFIKNLYNSCILRFEEQEDLGKLNPNDAKILALLLGEYRDENGSLSTNVQRYNRQILNAINQLRPIGSLDNHQISKLEKPKVVYRCLMEQCAVDGTIEDGSWSGDLYELINDFELSTNSKRAIEESVKKEMRIAGVEYFYSKYSKNDWDMIDNEFLVDISKEEDIDTIDNDEIDYDVPIEIDYSNNTDEYISEHIKKDEVKEFCDKNIHIKKYINCEGKLIFKNCIIYYNESSESGDEITLEQDAEIVALGCRFVCKGYDEAFFIKNNDSSASIVMKNCEFIDCGYFLKLENCSFSLDNGKIINCYKSFLNYRNYSDKKYKNSFSYNSVIFDSIPVYSAEKINKDGTIIDIRSKDVVFNNNVFEQNKKINDLQLSFVNGNGVEAIDCSFKNITNSIEMSKVNNCMFHGCIEPIRTSTVGDEYCEIIDSTFNECKNVISGWGHFFISKCKFIDSSGYLIHYDGVEGDNIIEYCDFKDSKGIDFEGEIKKAIASNPLANTMLLKFQIWSKSDLICFDSSKISKTNIIKNCTFDGVNLSSNYLISSISDKKPSEDTIKVDNCSFTNCKTKRKDKKIIKVSILYDTLVKKDIEYKAVTIRDCKGLENTILVE